MQKNTFFAVSAVALCLIAPLSARAAGRDTIVFISDLHMNVDASYAWLRTNAPPLAAFINRVNAREDVSELVILGDMLDDWVETVENAPHSFADVLAAPNNAGIVAALQAVCRNPDIAVTYVAGNHDMLSCVPENKAVITNAIPGLNVISEEPGLGAYTKNNVIWAEHGHRYCMFNAPDTWSRSNGHLPLGYFISRIAASKSEREHRVYTTMEALDTMIKSPDSYYAPGAGGEKAAFSDEFISALFDAFALVWGGFWPWNTFKMNGVDRFTANPSVFTIGNTYNSIYSEWPNRMDRVHQYEAVWNEVGDLSSAANLLFEMPDRIKSRYPFTPRIVLFGHTHEAAFSYHCGATNFIYANTGTWVDGKPRTWVEIEITPAGAQNFYTVSLWFDGESTPRQRATLDPFPGGNGPLVKQDFDGDGKSDLAVFDRTTGLWYITTLDGTVLAWDLQWGWSGAWPLTGDYDGDGITDLAVFDPTAGLWYIATLESPASGSKFKVQGSKLEDESPNTEHRSPITTSPHTLNAEHCTLNTAALRVIAWGIAWGWPGAYPINGDFDGDGKSDLAVFDRTTGLWYIATLDGAVLAWAFPWGWTGAWPVGAF